MTHFEIINLWPSLTDFADDIEVKYGTAKAMRRRSSIPAGYWPLVVAKAFGRGIDGVTIEILARAVAERSTMEAAE